MNAEIVKVIPITSKVISEEQFLLLLDKNDNVYVYPNTDKTKMAAKEAMNRLTHCHVMQSGNLLTGHRFSPEKLSAVEIWRLNFDETDEEIVAYASDDQLTPEDYQGIEENDGNIMYKYIDPNLMAIVTFSTSNDFNKASNALRIYVINRVNGAIVYSGHIYNVHSKEDIKVKFVENIIMVNYLKLYDEKPITILNEMLVIEMYYPEIENDVQKMISQYFSKGIQVGGIDSAKLPIPKVLTQSYIIPVLTKDFVLTRTLQGITNKHVVFLTTENKLMAIPSVFLSARRPTGNPNREGAEFEDSTTTPYDGVIRISHTLNLNYNLALSGITDLKSIPEEYESTTLIIASGIDLFVSHFAPERVIFLLIPRNMMV